MPAVYINRDLAAVPTDGELCAKIDSYRDQRLAAGYRDTTSQKTFQCDPRSISYWNGVGSSALAAITLGLTPEPVYELIAADNSTALLTATEALQLMNGRVMPWVSDTIHFARAMKDAVLSGNRPADITVGWP